MRMNSAARRSAACAIVIVCIVGAQAQQKPCLTASKFGPDDQIGNLNYVTPAKTLAASKLVTRGKALPTRNRDEQGHAGLPSAHLRDHGSSAGPVRRGHARPD